MTASLPRVGARIRVAVVGPNLDTYTEEGVVEGVTVFGTDGGSATLRLDDTTTSTVRVSPGQGYYATWMELLPPVPALPAEPPLYAFNKAIDELARYIGDERAALRKQLAAARAALDEAAEQVHIGHGGLTADCSRIGCASLRGVLAPALAIGDEVSRG